MKAAILIVGDDLALLQTRADLLKAWRVSTTTAEHAIEAIRSTAHDLIILCQTIPDATAQTLIDQAREMNPDVATLALKHPGQERILDAKLFEVQITKPGRFLRVVDRLLQTSSFKSSDEERAKLPSDRERETM
jgi:CheY-like chemotaxis protein